MREHFRQSMSWLHTWAGLTSGWVLCAIFLTGTLSVFREPITRWMQARPAVPAPVSGPGPATGADPVALARAVAHLTEHGTGARFWRLELPARAGDAMLLVWQPQKGPRGGLHAAMDPETGRLLPTPWGRKTEGGRHFMSFHYMLHADTAGFWVVGWLAMCMLVALVSGVVVHRRIFQDFFTFRPHKGQRSWLDAHNVAAVLTLPFLFMIVYTGLSIFYTSYMPWPLRAAYGAGEAAHARFEADTASAAPLPKRPRADATAPVHPLLPLVREAEAKLSRPAGMVLVERPGDRSMVVKVIARRDDGATRTIADPPRQVAFDGVDGAVLQVQDAPATAKATPADIHHVMEALHLVRFGGWTMKWLYFASGLLGTSMIATGAVLFAVKRRQRSQREFGNATARVYRAVDALNTAAVAGIAIASIAYFHANRLLPADVPARDVWEIRAFFGAWLLSLLHAAWRPGLRAWVEQFGVAALLCLALPFVNALTTGGHWIAYLSDGDGQRAGVELTALLLGLGCAAIAARVNAAATAGRDAAPARGARA